MILYYVLLYVYYMFPIFYSPNMRSILGFLPLLKGLVNGGAAKKLLETGTFPVCFPSLLSQFAFPTE